MKIIRVNIHTHTHIMIYTTHTHENCIVDLKTGQVEKFLGIQKVNASQFIHIIK